MIRVLPFSILMAAVVAGGWRLSEPARRHARIRSLLQRHRELPPSAWAPADVEALWEAVATSPPEPFLERLLDDLHAEDAGRRRDAIQLAAALRNWWKFGRFLSDGPPAFLPWPRRGLPLEPIAELVETALLPRAAAFGRLAVDPSPRARKAFAFIAPVDVAREAYERMALEDPDEDLQRQATYGLGDAPPTPSTLATLHAIAARGPARRRLEATAVLAKLGDLVAARELVAAFTLPPRGLDGFDLIRAASWPWDAAERVKDGRIDAVHYWGFLGDPPPCLALPCDLRAPWEAWLARRWGDQE